MTTGTSEVVSSASVAVPLRHRQGAPMWSGRRFSGSLRVVAASMRRTLLTPRGVARPPRIGCSARCGYLERSLMAREADRL
ncbi:hypothetical protein [Mycobacterium servetii]|uniref:Uncharacterized protein n=1 Tax=Mycobacterium servetii TaxID=3237418 RepID=A0ABV4C298_9MYCO